MVKENLMKNGKWSRKYDTCQSCFETKRKHKGLGLCLACFDRRRAKINPKRREQLKRASRKFYDKNKDTDEYKEYNRKIGIEWRKGQVYKEYLKKVYARNRVNRYLKTGWKTHIKKLDNTLTIAFNGKHIKTTVRIKKAGLDAIDIYELNFFKKRLQENCDNKS